jgi:hypothetical protein
MNDFTWVINKTYTDNGNNLTVLQRPLGDLREAITEEFRPFRYEPSLFQLSVSDQTPQKLVGFLAEMKLVQSDLIIEMRSADQHLLVKWLVPKYTDVNMTVWRLNSILDTLQVNISGIACDFYMQTGGAGVKRIFFENRLRPEPNAQILQAEIIFAKNATFN